MVTNDNVQIEGALEIKNALLYSRNPKMKPVVQLWE